MGSADDPGSGEPPGSAGGEGDTGQHPRPAQQANAPDEASMNMEVTTGRLSQDSIVPETPPSQESQQQDVTPTEGSAAPVGPPTAAAEAKCPAEKDREGKDGPGSSGQDAQHDKRAVEQEATPQELFTAVVTARRADPKCTPRDAWLSTTAELYRIFHDRVQVNEELIPAGKRRYPKLNREEKTLIFELLEEACIKRDETFQDWARHVTKATYTLYNTRWAFKTILRSKISGVKWAHNDPINPWEHLAASRDSPLGAQQNPREYETFMFNPARYPPAEIATLRQLCQQPPAARMGQRLREGTEEEWKIIRGLAEGTIVCRTMPAFLQSVLGSQERLRLHTTIQWQVEGELVLSLRGWISVRASRQNTRALKEDILLAAECTRVNQPELRRMLTVAKTISYNQAKRTVHFYFFNRETARKYELAMVPFKGTVYRLMNMHRPESGSIWARQLGADGTRTTMQREYAVELHNVTRFLDIGRLTAYLRANIATPLDLEDLDTCTPDSSTSTVWRLTVKMAGCPEFLRGIVRIIWFGQSIVVKHPSVGQRLQCLRCGNLGHTLAKCRYNEEQLRGAGSRVAADADVAQLEDLAKPFGSLQEVHDSAAKRLQLQTAADMQAQSAVTPSPITRGHPTSGAAQEALADTQQSRADRSPATANKVTPASQTLWATMPSHRGRKQAVHSNRAASAGITGSRYAALAESDDEEPESKAEAQEQNKASPAIEVSSGPEIDEQEQPITAEAKAQLHLNAAKPSSVPETPQLVVRQQRENDALQQATEPLTKASKSPIPMVTGALGSPIQFPAIEHALGMQPVSTPATGNCMAMALAQAVAEDDLAAHNDILEQATASIKRGIRWTGLMGQGTQYTHYVRTTTLVNVQRGWMDMTPKESKKQFLWYLEDYATTPSDREATVAPHNWGSSELLATAASFLHRKIFVLAYDIDHSHEWNCSMYRPGVMTRGNQTFEIGQQVPLSVKECVEAIRQAKLKAAQLPIVLRFWGQHYSAYVHSKRLSRARKPEPASEEKTESDYEMEEPSRDGTSERGASQDPWDPSQWNGDVAELQDRLQGLTMSHELQREVNDILATAQPKRYAELIAFLVNTVSQLSRAERDQLLRLDLADEDNRETIQLLQRYSVPRIVLQQWKRTIAKEKLEDEQREEEQAASSSQSSDSSFQPSQESTSSSLSSVPTPNMGARERDILHAKRMHTITPQEGEEIRRQRRLAKDIAQNVPDVSAKRNGKEPRHTRGSSPARKDWCKLWNTLAQTWPATSHGTIPKARGSTADWIQAVQSEPDALVRLVKQFPYPDELLGSLGPTVKLAWTANWRRDCLLRGLTGLLARMEDQETKRWVDQWIAKFRRIASQNLAPLIDDEKDWKRLRNKNYGNDPVLKMCDINNKRRFAHHVLCATIFDHEIFALMDNETDEPIGIYDKLQTHLTTLYANEEYADVYEDAEQLFDWKKVALFFAEHIEHGEQDSDAQH